MKKILVIMISALVIFFATSTLALDKTPGILKFNSLNYVRIVTVGSVKITNLITDETFQSKWVYEEMPFTISGSGIIVDKFIITVNHVLEPPFDTVNILDRLSFISSNLRNDLDMLNDSWRARIIYHDPKSDMALLRYTGRAGGTEHKFLKTKDYLNYRYQSDNIGKGDAVTIVARKRDDQGHLTSEFELRHGKILSLGISEDIPRDALPILRSTDFTTDLKIYSGDSGLPVFGYLYGKPLIIGLVRARMLKNDPPRAFIGRIDPIVRILSAENVPNAVIRPRYTRVLP